MNHDAKLATPRQRAISKQKERMDRRSIQPLPDPVIDQTLREFSKTSV